MDTSKIQGDLTRHETFSEISTEEYVRARDLELGMLVMARKLIYLDKRFWIALQDARINRTKDTTAHTLLTNLSKSVQQGRRICPISGV